MPQKQLFIFTSVRFETNYFACPPCSHALRKANLSETLDNLKRTFLFSSYLFTKIRKEYELISIGVINTIRPNKT